LEDVGVARPVRLANLDADRAADLLGDARQHGAQLVPPDRLVWTVDVGYSGMSMDRPDLRRLLDHVAAQQVGYCVVSTRDRLSEDPEHMADIDEALDDALVAIVVAADHTGPAGN
jgi:DNA invertase Pin-like site-specific DNA recombinase